MIYLVIPLFLFILSNVILFLITQFWRKDTRISIGDRIALGLGFFMLGLFLTALAVAILD
jgi:ABC-type Fe3+-siderophore transport system permease subunit